MYSIQLNRLRFFAHHGWHDEEGLTGSEFEVSLSVDFNPEAIHTLSDTINYESVFRITQARFLKPVKLLENLAAEIVEEIHKIDDRISAINITIEKLNAPIANFTGTVGIRFSKSFPA